MGKPTTCSVCNKSFSCRDYLLSHKKTHDDPESRKIGCSQCDKVYLTADGLKRHVRQVHSSGESEKPFVCDYCDKRFWDSTHLKAHRRKHTGERPFPCPQCNATFAMKSSRDSHVRNVHRETEERTHNCPHPGCTKRFRNLECLRGHLKVHASGGRPMYPCPTSGCGKTYKTKEGMKRHVQFYHEGRELEHTCCNKRFPFAAALAVHIRCHTGEKPYPCNFCGKRFAQLGVRGRHETNIHTDKGHIHAMRTISTREPQKQPTLGVRSMSKEGKTCPICKKTIGSLQRHMRSHTGEKPYACPDCPAKFGASERLSAHRMYVHRTGDTVTYTCPLVECGKIFKSPYSLKGHVARHSADRPTYSCPNCGSNFLSKVGLKLHAKVKHERILKSHSCLYCEKKFETTAKLRAHMPTHTGEKPYSCSKCPRRYPYLSSLHSHEASFHRNERPHGCPQCESRFNRRGDLKLHMETHKSKTERQLFECTECGEKMTNKANLKCHMAGHHQDAEKLRKRCPFCDKTFARAGGLNCHIRNIHTGEK